MSHLPQWPQENGWNGQSYPVGYGRVWDLYSWVNALWSDVSVLKMTLQQEREERERESKRLLERVTALEEQVAQLQQPRPVSEGVSATQSTNTVDGHIAPYREAVPRAVVAPMASVSPEIGRLHLFGGFSQDNTVQKTVETLYRESGDLWKEVNLLPDETLCVHASAVTIDRDNAFLFSGFPSGERKNAIYRFNCRSETWMPIHSRLSRCLGSCVRLDNAICIAGGYLYTAQAIQWSQKAIPFPSSLSAATADNTVHLFKPDHDYWETVSSLSEPKVGCTLLSISRDVMYCLGGLTIDRGVGKPSRWIERFDRREGQWRLIGQLMHARAFFDAVAINTSIVSMGGISHPVNNEFGFNGDDQFASVEQLDFRMNRPSPLEDMESGRCFFTAHVLDDDSLYVLGGRTRIHDQSIPYVLGSETYSFSNKTWKAGFLAGASNYRYGHASCVL